MGVGSPVSAVISLLLCILIFGGMQMYKQEIALGEWRTILGGFFGSWMFVFGLTAINNLENTLFGEGFQSQLVPEVALSLAGSLFACSLIHRVCVTTCFIFSMIALYYLNAISTEKYGSPATPSQTPATPAGKKRRH